MSNVDQALTLLQDCLEAISTRIDFLEERIGNLEARCEDE